MVILHKYISRTFKQTGVVERGCVFLWRRFATSPTDGDAAIFTGKGKIDENGSEMNKLLMGMEIIAI